MLRTSQSTVVKLTDKDNVSKPSYRYEEPAYGCKNC